MDQSWPSTRTAARVFLTVVGLAALLYLAWLVRGTLILIFISIFVAAALGPAVDWLQRAHIPRVVAILIVYLLLFATVIGLGLLVVPPIVSGIESFANDLPGTVRDLRQNSTFRELDRSYGITEQVIKQAEQLPSRVGDAATALQDITLGLFAVGVQLVTVLTISFILLLQGRRISEAAFNLVGEQREERVRAVSEDVYRSVAPYVLGKVLMSIVAGVVTYVTLTLLGVPFAIPLTLLMAFLSFIPMVGATIGAVIIGIVTLFQGFPTSVIAWTVVSVVYQQFENNILQPIVFRRAVDVHPIVVIVSILMGATLLGIVGALIAIPVAAAIQIIGRDWWRIRKGETPEQIAAGESGGGDSAEAAAPG